MFLEAAWYQFHIYEMDTINHPLSVDPNARNSMRSKTRSRLENVLVR